MSSPVESIQISGYACDNLTPQQLEKAAQMMVSDRAQGRYLDLPGIGKVDRAKDPLVTIQIRWVPGVPN